MQPPATHKGPQRFYEKLAPDDQALFLGLIQQRMELASPQAHDRRQEETGYVFGVSISGLIKYLNENLPNHIKMQLGEIKPTSFRHLFCAPNKGHREARRYWGVIQARVARGQNNLHAHHDLVRSLASFLLLSPVPGPHLERQCSCHQGTLHLVRFSDHLLG